MRDGSMNTLDDCREMCHWPASVTGGPDAGDVRDTGLAFCAELGHS